MLTGFSTKKWWNEINELGLNFVADRLLRNQCLGGQFPVVRNAQLYTFLVHCGAGLSVEITRK
jgi:hypothetical protein